MRSLTSDPGEMQPDTDVDSSSGQEACEQLDGIVMHCAEEDVADNGYAGHGEHEAPTDRVLVRDQRADQVDHRGNCM